MRTVLLSSVAALALTFATGSLVPAQAQTPAPSAPAAAPAPAPATPPADSATPPDVSSPSATSTPEHPAPMMHHHRMHHVMTTSGSDSASADSEHWAHQPGTGESGPESMRASNIDAADTHSTIAPHFPQPAVGPGADPDTLLQAAQSALAAHKTGTAQQALEMAETRLLDRSTAPDAANQPDQGPRIAAVTQARKALASGNTQAADSAIQMAMSTK